MAVAGSDLMDGLDGLMGFWDFPMESLEDDGSGGIEDDFDTNKFQCLGPIPNEAFFSFSSPSKADMERVTSNPLLMEDQSQVKHLPSVGEEKSTIQVKEPEVFQAPSPNSVLESSGSCSVEKCKSVRSDTAPPVRTRSNRTVKPTFKKSYMISSFSSASCATKGALTPRKRKDSKKKKISPISGAFKTKKNTFQVAYNELEWITAEMEMVETPVERPRMTKECPHCKVNKTPQWRKGPLGPLCNACGIHYRSGSLFPEYHPAASQASVPSSLLSGAVKMKENTFQVADNQVEQKSAEFEMKETHMQWHLNSKKCANCEATKTPQWQEGPFGAKTLCNACGVHYQSGSLLQEDHLAASQTLVPSSLPSDTVKMKRKRKTSPGTTKKLDKIPAEMEMMNSPKRQSLVVRKCTHCGVTKTPQWREGPLGRLTLCNACGVRYRSGRLFPEYRPAASPTFVPSLHSNFHRKVINIREEAMKEAAMSQTGPPCIPSLHSNSHQKVIEMTQNRARGCYE